MMDLFTSLLLLGIVLSTAHFVFKKQKSNYPYPPGPKPLPVIGNLLQFPTTHLGDWFRKLHNQYGPIIHVHIGNTHLVSIGEYGLAREVLERKSAINSSRPVFEYTERYLNADGRYWVFAKNDSKPWKVARKLTSQLMQKERLRETEHFMTMEARLTAMKVLEGPESWIKQFERLSTSLAMGSVFGIQGITGEEPEIKEMNAINDIIVASAQPTSSILNFFPFLDRLPGNFLPWRRGAAAFQRRQDALFGNLTKEAVVGSKSQMNTWCKYFHEAGEEKGNAEGISLLSGQLFSAATETTSNSLSTFVLALVIYKDAFIKVYKQLDEVVPENRLPEFSDREHLSLIDAAIQETLRIFSPVPQGIPHESTEDQIISVEGIKYAIPKGTSIFGTSYAIDNDPKRFSNPSDFTLEHHFDKQGHLDLKDITAFGFGRRICPGAPFALNAMWITVTTLLWAFEFEKQPKYEYFTDGRGFNGAFTNAPLPFPCVIKPRSPERVEILRRAWDLQEKNLEILLPVPRKSK